MKRYIARRFLYMLLLLFFGSMVSFLIITLPPGDYLSYYVDRVSMSGASVSEEDLAGLRAFFASHPDTFSFPPTFAREWVERETINDVIAKHGIGGEIDLLSIDLDGVDYWVWDALDGAESYPEAWYFDR